METYATIFGELILTKEIMNTRLNLILLLIVAVLIGWYVGQKQTEHSGLADLIKREGEPEYRGEQVQTMVYDLNGKPQYFAQAMAINRYENTERIEFLHPLLNLFDPDTALKQWQIRADHAEINKEKILNLTGHVKLENLEDNARLSVIETQQLSINLTTQDIETEALVRSEGLGFVSTGTGLSGNLKKQVATLKRDVKTQIEPTIIKPSSPNQ